MKRLAALVLAMAAACAMPAVSAAPPTKASAAASSQEHDHEHAEESTGTQASRPTKSAASQEQVMGRMRDMHSKMMSAGTPEERERLMNEHMKTMQDGMAMMRQMRPRQGGAASSQNLQKRMDMMEMMMQMMVDRESVEDAAARR